MSGSGCTATAFLTWELQGDGVSASYIWKENVEKEKHGDKAYDFSHKRMRRKNHKKKITLSFS
jgi:hypothetical protein